MIFDKRVTYLSVHKQFGEAKRKIQSRINSFTYFLGPHQCFRKYGVMQAPQRISDLWYSRTHILCTVWVHIRLNANIMTDHDTSCHANVTTSIRDKSRQVATKRDGTRQFANARQPHRIATWNAEQYYCDHSIN